MKSEIKVGIKADLEPTNAQEFVTLLWTSSSYAEFRARMGTEFVCNLAMQITDVAAQDAENARRISEATVAHLAASMDRLTERCKMLEEAYNQVLTDYGAELREADGKQGPKDNYGTRFFIVECSDGIKWVTRSKNENTYGRPLTREELYRGWMDEAECEYAHAFMCGGFPTKPDPDRPTKEEWLAEEPYEYEVDRFVTKKIFPEAKRP